MGPRAGALRGKHLLGDCNLLFARCLPCVACVVASAMREPRVGMELETAVVFAVEVPVATRFTLRDRIPIRVVRASRSRRRLTDLSSIILDLLRGGLCGGSALFVTRAFLPEPHGLGAPALHFVLERGCEFTDVPSDLGSVFSFGIELVEPARK